MYILLTVSTYGDADHAKKQKKINSLSQASLSPFECISNIFLCCVIYQLRLVVLPRKVLHSEK